MLIFLWSGTILTCSLVLETSMKNFDYELIDTVSSVQVTLNFKLLGSFEYAPTKVLRRYPLS